MRQHYLKSLYFTHLTKKKDFSHDLLCQLNNFLKNMNRFVLIPVLVLAERIPEIRFSGTRNQPKNGFIRQVKPDFSSFFAKVLPYIMIFQSGAHRSCCGKALFNLPPQPISSRYCWYPKPGFRVSEFCHNWLCRN